MLLNCGVGEDSWESLEQQGAPTSTSERKSVLSIPWKDWCWSWNYNTLATWCEELTHLKRPWCWERLKAGGEGDNRGWDNWMASPTQWTWVWVNSRSWWWMGRPVVLQSMGSQRVGQDWATELNWKEQMKCCISHSVLWDRETSLSAESSYQDSGRKLIAVVLCSMWGGAQKIWSTYLHSLSFHVLLSPCLLSSLLLLMWHSTYFNMNDFHMVNFIHLLLIPLLPKTREMYLNPTSSQPKMGLYLEIEQLQM